MAGCQWYVISAFVLVCVSHLGGACTEDTFGKYETCSYQFYTVLDSTMASGSKAQLDAFCASGSKAHIDCVENVAAECRNAKGFYRRVWDNIINVDGVTNTLELTCKENTLNNIVANHKCINKTQPTAGNCIAKEYFVYKGQLTFLGSQIPVRGTDWYEDELYKAVCTYVENIRDCEKPFGEKCGEDIGKLYDDRSDAGIPPVCSAVTSTTNVLMVAFLSLLACFKGEI